jgi:two-component system, cell cycle sensor histidine kinase and response regulator CckA
MNPAAEQEIAKTVFREAYDAFLVVRPGDLRVLDVNPAVQRLTGLGRKQLVGSSLPDLFEGTASAALEDVIRACQATSHLTARDGYRLKTLSGESIPVHVTVNRVPVEPQPLALLVVRDLSDRKRVEENLKEVRQFHEQVIASAREGIVVYNRELRYTVWNPYMEELTGLPAAEVLGQLPWDLFPFLREQGIDQLLVQALSGRSVEAPEAHFHSPSKGRSGWVSARYGPLRDAHGHIVGVIATIRDITERRRIEEAGRAAHRTLQVVLDNIPQGVFWKDRESRYLGCNRVVCRAFGLRSPEEIVGRDDFHLPGVTREQAAFFIATDRQVMATDTPQFRIVETATLADGSSVWLETSKIPMHDAEGKVVGVLGTWLDVTDRRRAEEENRKLESQIQHARKLESLGVLAGGIAHDFNNLLTSILGFSDLARLESPDGPARGYLDEVIRGAGQAAELTQQMLAYSGKGRFVAKDVRLSTLVDEFRTSLEVSIPKKCVVNYRLAPDLPAVKADPAQLRQVVINLLINASEALGERGGTIAVTTGMADCDRAYLAEAVIDENFPAGRYVFLEVADDGCGMSEETRKKIFDPFFSTKFTGRGLGLAAVLGIVRGHRGALRVQSEPGVGSTFQILFPPSGESPAVRAPSGEEDDSWRGTGTVLLVDDEPSVRGMAGQMLEALGFAVLTAKDGREGVERFRLEHERLSLVLLDMTMPNLDGEQAYRAMRLLADVPTILSSGYNEQATSTRLAGTGLAGFIQKPYRLADLRAAIRNALGR